MNNVKRCTYEEIKQMPIGSVVWCESHGILEGYKSDIEFYDVFPMLITESGENGSLIWCDKDSSRIIRITAESIDNDPDTKYWDGKPEKREGTITAAEAQRISEEQEPGNIVYLRKSR